MANLKRKRQPPSRVLEDRMAVSFRARFILTDAVNFLICNVRYVPSRLRVHSRAATECIGPPIKKEGTIRSNNKSRFVIDLGFL